MGERILTASTVAFAYVLFVVSNLILLVAFAFLLAALIVIGVRPIIATIGVQMQMAAFADRLQSKHPRFLTWSALIRHAVLFSLGLILGFFLTPTAGPLSPGTFAINAPALLLLPVYVLGWAIVFLAWAIPLCQLAGRLYMAHRTPETPLKKRKSLQLLAALALLPLLVAMTITQMLLGESGGSAAVATSSLILTVPGWTVAFILSSLMWLSAWVLFGIRGWLTVDGDQNQLPSWALHLGPRPLPTPPQWLPDLSGPPPL
jgi:hypothetical protein